MWFRPPSKDATPLHRHLCAGHRTSQRCPAHPFSPNPPMSEGHRMRLPMDGRTEAGNHPGGKRSQASINACGRKTGTAGEKTQRAALAIAAHCIGHRSALRWPSRPHAFERKEHKEDQGRRFCGAYTFVCGIKAVLLHYLSERRGIASAAGRTAANTAHPTHL